MNYIEDVTAKIHNGWYVDLFVRPSNSVAVRMYRNFGYDVYQTVYQYYSSASGKYEDAYDMRKSMPRDKLKVKQKPTGQTIQPRDLEFN
jgi:N-terminal acetyltransferase B complex catalytic subunit